MFMFVDLVPLSVIRLVFRSGDCLEVAYEFIGHSASLCMQLMCHLNDVYVVLF
jgi:hypothetical protein